LNPVSNELTRRAQAGDQHAFEQLYREHAGRVYALCLRLSADPVAARELTQDVFVRAWEKLQSFRGESAFSSWLHRLAVNVSWPHNVWTSRRERRVSGTEGPRNLPGAVRADAPLGWQWISRAPLPALPPGARVVFVLHDIEGL